MVLNFSDKFDCSPEESMLASDSMPYAAIRNPVGGTLIGFSVKKEYADIARFDPSSENGWSFHSIRYGKGKDAEVIDTWIGSFPRAIVLHRSPIYQECRSKEVLERRLFLKKDPNWKVFSYAVVFFVDRDKKILSERPFRLLMSGASGSAFSRKFCDKKSGTGFIYDCQEAYSALTGDRKPKLPVFYSHFIMSPIFEIGEAGKEEVSEICECTGYEVPTPENLESMTIEPGTPESKIIQEWHEKTKDWVKLPPDNSITGDDEGSGDSLSQDSSPLLVEPRSSNSNDRPNDRHLELRQLILVKAKTVGWSTDYIRQRIKSEFGASSSQELSVQQLETFLSLMIPDRETI